MAGRPRQEIAWLKTINAFERTSPTASSNPLIWTCENRRPLVMTARILRVFWIFWSGFASSRTRSAIFPSSTVPTDSSVRRKAAGLRGARLNGLHRRQARPHQERELVVKAEAWEEVVGADIAPGQNRHAGIVHLANGLVLGAPHAIVGLAILRGNARSRGAKRQPSSLFVPGKVAQAHVMFADAHVLGVTLNTMQDERRHLPCAGRRQERVEAVDTCYGPACPASSGRMLRSSPFQAPGRAPANERSRSRESDSGAPNSSGRPSPLRLPPPEMAHGRRTESALLRDSSAIAK